MPVASRAVPPAVALVATVVLASSWAGASAATAATRTVEVQDYAYAPAEVEIVAGDTVTWRWVGEDRHSVTAPGTFDSHPDCTPLMPEACGTAGTTFSWTSSEPGTVEYGCRIHPDRMRGSITVVAASAQPSPSEEPLPTASPSPRPSPRPSARPSPSPTRAPAPAPDAASPSPSPSPSPSRPPTRRAGPSLRVGEAEMAGSPAPGDGGEDDVAAPRVSDVSPEPLEPFPAAPSPRSSPDPVADDVVAIGEPGGTGRQAVRIAGVVAVAASLFAFGRVVLFGRPWA